MSVEFIAHIERHLGDIVDGWPAVIDGVSAPCTIVRTARGPVDGSQCLVTLGISETPLRMPSGPRVRFELVFAYRERSRVLHFPGVLRELAIECVRNDRAPVRGVVFGPRGLLVDGTQLEALYVAIPVYFPREFHRFDRADGEPVIFAWLVPITKNEALLVNREGWSALEKRLAERDPDLLDMDRESVVPD
jgi:hypothetical protein